MGDSSSKEYQFPEHSSSANYQVTYHRHPNICELLRIFRLFLEEPYAYLKNIEIIKEDGYCCDKAILKVEREIYGVSLEAVMAGRRARKVGFGEKEIWYLVKGIIGVLGYMQSQGIVMGICSPNMLYLSKGRFLTFEILHLLPENEHARILSLHSYYSPEQLQAFDNPLNNFPHSSSSAPSFFLPFPQKSEVFSFGLLLLELATCPNVRPKFHRSNLRSILWENIDRRLQYVRDRYSDRLMELFEMLLREDVRIRPDWGYLGVWLKKNEKYVDIAPCLFNFI